MRDCPGKLSIQCLPLEYGTREFREYADWDLACATFTVPIKREARELARKCFDREMPWRGRDFLMDVRLPEVFSPEVPQGDILGYFVACADEWRIPAKIRKRLAEFLSTGGPYSDEDIRLEVENLLETMPDNVRWTIRGLELQEQRYDAEPISLDIVNPNSGFGL